MMMMMMMKKNHSTSPNVEFSPKDACPWTLAEVAITPEVSAKVLTLEVVPAFFPTAAAAVAVRVAAAPEGGKCSVRPGCRDLALKIGVAEEKA